MQRQKRYKHGLFIAEGERLVSDALSCGCVEYVMVAQSYGKKVDFPRTYCLCDKLFKSISDTVTTQGIIAVCRINPGSFDQISGWLVVICDGIGDPGHLGTIIRSAECSGAVAALLIGNCADPYSPKTVRATMGSIFRMPICQATPSDLSKLSEYDIIAAVLENSTDLYDMKFGKNTAFIIGNEARGVSKAAASFANSFVRIPMDGRAESLNAAVAAALIMYEVRRQNKQE